MDEGTCIGTCRHMSANVLSEIYGQSKYCMVWAYPYGTLGSISSEVDLSCGCMHLQRESRMTAFCELVDARDFYLGGENSPEVLTGGPAIQIAGLFTACQRPVCSIPWNDDHAQSISCRIL
jgi:hypothetical protein